MSGDMITELQRLLNMVRASLQDDFEINRIEIQARLKGIADVMGINLSNEELINNVRKLEAEIPWTMGIGSTLTDNSPHNKWISQNREHIDWYYWNRYKTQLHMNGFGPTVVGKMDIVTDEILDLLQNPKDDGNWQRKGLVVGHVQSGKTANYVALVCKAIDAGYKVVIILAGLLNSLRKQTQARVDSGIIGLDSSLMLEEMPLVEKLIGVGNIDHKFRPISITTAHSDFKKEIATKLQTEIEQFSRPVVFVIKKNVSILGNLTDWLKSNNIDLSNHPLLLIDDEADHASINTKKEDLDPTRTNEKIRELLQLFPKNIYLGYTATPFANIFINPESSEDMMNDLFPENFIKSLDPPSNYFGARKIFFGKNLNIMRDVVDFADFLPFKHKISDVPRYLPESLKTAVRIFIIVSAIRILRGQKADHNSMLINVTRFTLIQSEIRVLIHNYLSQLRNSISNYILLDDNEALNNPDIKNIYETWLMEYEQNTDFSWSEIKNKLKLAASRIEVIEVNSSPNAEKDIDYSKRNFPDGRHLIAIGGLSLSRGITLEGLSVSYFLRNSLMYDTLMQMARWFGYRTGFEDICRIYMPEQARGWYEHIAEATEELRNEFRKMEILKKTPKDFGLAVRNHPESLLVTARNKMRSAKTVVREIDLTGVTIETSRLFTSKKSVNHNLRVANNLLKKLVENHRPTQVGKQNLLFNNINSSIISDFILSFENHPESSLTDSNSVRHYVDGLDKNDGYDKWRILFANPESESNIKTNYKYLDNLSLGVRKTTTSTTSGIILGRRKLAPGGFEKSDLKYYNEQTRTIPILIIHLLDCRDKNKPDIPLFINGVVGYSISFPGAKEGQKIKKLATYQVNTIWMKNQYENQLEDENDLEGEL